MPQDKKKHSVLQNSFDITDVVDHTIDRVQAGEELVDPAQKALDAMTKSKIPEFQTKALYMLAPDNPFRKALIKLTYSRFFEGFILFAILCNCVTLAMGDPICQNENISMADAEKNCSKEAAMMFAIGEVTSIIFLAIFTMEFVLKVLAQGFFVEPRVSYLRDPWNWLDFVVVIISWLQYIPSFGNLSALRTFRVLRPLRAISVIPGMKVILKSMLDSLAALTWVLVLWMFFFFVFGIIGIQLWGGLFDARCHIKTFNATENSTSYSLDENDERMCALKIATSTQNCDTETTTCSTLVSGGYTCDDVHYGPGLDVVERECRRVDVSDGPSFGFGNFNNMYNAIFLVFTSITLEGWVDNYYNVIDSFGNWFFAFMYFLLLILLGSYFMLNLALAVIWEEYDDASHEEIAAQEMIAEVSGANTEEARNALRTKKAEMRRRKEERHRPKPCCKCILKNITVFVQSTGFEMVITSLIILNTVGLALDSDPPVQELQEFLDIMNYVFTGVFFLEMVLKIIGLGLCVYLQRWLQPL